MTNEKVILRVLVGSRAHGLHTEDSDYDWRGVFVTPTSEILKLGGTMKQTSWIEGKEDDTSWEIGKFLLLATKCNPTILEVFKAQTHPVRIQNALWGIELQGLFDAVWSSKYVRDAFVGYGLNQRKKFLDNKDVRPQKYAVAYLRTLYQATELLETGNFSVNMEKTPIFEKLKRWKNKDYTVGDVIETCHNWEQKVEEAFKRNPDKQPNIDLVNEYLLRIRKENWS
jgi:uncharacterized protein